MARTRTFFMLLRATPEWLGLAPPARFAFLDTVLRPLLAAHPGVRLRFFESEAYSARVSDLAVWETADLEAWESLVEGLREGPFWDRYFAVLDILPAVENAFAAHYGVAPLGAG